MPKTTASREAHEHDLRTFGDDIYLVHVVGRRIPWMIADNVGTLGSFPLLVTVLCSTVGRRDISPGNLITPAQCPYISHRISD